MKRIALSTALLTTLTGFLLVFSTSNCKKDKSDPAEPTCLLTRISINGEDFIFAYDAQNRVTRADNPNGYYTTFTYDSDKVVCMFYGENDVFDSQLVCELNAAGDIDHIEFSDIPETVDLTYDANGYLERFVDHYNNNTYTIDYDIAGGNFISQTGQYDGGGDIEQQIYDYYPDKENKNGQFNVFFYTGFSDGDLLHLLPLGKSSRNLLKKMTILDNGQVQETIEFDYEFTPEGYVSAILYGNGERADFDYQCR